MNAGVAVCGVGRVQLITAADPSKIFVSTDSVIYRECIITRDSKYISDADVVKPAKNMLNDRLGHTLLLRSHYSSN
jgi:hypothetical protein